MLLESDSDLYTIYASHSYVHLFFIPVRMFAFCQGHRGAEEPLGPVRLLQLVCVSTCVCINGSGLLPFIPRAAAVSVFWKLPRHAGTGGMSVFWFF